uniref:Uncharacterized protein n=1 Tax=Oryza sativa subsp. japonica TaxID=39947 RepID=Q5VPW4_ORYSJ|nr:hypothetical protein [Oryza sativa Japonica Group]
MEMWVILRHRRYGCPWPWARARVVKATAEIHPRCHTEESERRMGSRRDARGGMEARRHAMEEYGANDTRARI